MAAPKISVILEAVDSGLLGTLDKLGLKFVGIESALNLLNRAVANIKKGFQDLHAFLSAASDASAAQQRSLVQLGAALTATGKNAEGLVEHIADIAAELQKTTKFGDELTIEAAKWFAQMPRLDPDNMRDYMMAAQDLAEVMGVDLRIASQVLARALEDPRRASRALRRANVMLSTQQRRMLEVFDEAGDMAAAQAVILDAVAGSVGNAAQTMASTLEGVRGQIQGIMSDLMEHIGDPINDALLPATKAFKEGLEDLSEAFGMLRTDAMAAREEVDEFVRVAERMGGLDDRTEELAIERYNEALPDTIKLGHAAAKSIEGVSDAIVRTMKEGEQGGQTPFGWLFEGTALPEIYRQAVSFGELRAAEEAKNAVIREEREKAALDAIKVQSMMTTELNKRKAEQYMLEVEAENELARMRKSGAAWMERMRKDAMTDTEKVVANAEELLKLRKAGLGTEKEHEAIRKKLVEDYIESFGWAEKEKDAMEQAKDASTEMGRIAEKMNSVNKKLKAAEEPKDFKSVITSTSGLYDRISAAAASRKAEDKTVEELKVQRAALEVQYKAAQELRVKAYEKLDSIDASMEELTIHTEARFAR